MDTDFFFAGWSPIWHTLILGVIGYLVLVLLLRSTGPRTMAKMTPLDFVIAVTLGSTFGRTITAVDVSLAQAVVALVLLVGVQWLLAFLRARWTFMRRALDSPPVLLYCNGELQHSSLRKHRLTEVDVHAAARRGGQGSLKDIQAVILQQDGSLGVIQSSSIDDGSSVLPFVERQAS